ncbi:Hypothetical protein GbCGDNIH3_1650 [Granulibacter bethesdensis]|uniref:Uncharacterized protein n=1 Tax=Granulibacter bethesdensis TaxID=364410 RepID=A0AAN0VGE3_9PROT|nr:Hypothetical protein GbCGDNIH3_1650 [Granulibacter bethesdensis]
MEGHQIVRAWNHAVSFPFIPRREGAEETFRLYGLVCPAWAGVINYHALTVIKHEPSCCIATRGVR